MRIILLFLVYMFFFGSPIYGAFTERDFKSNFAFTRSKKDFSFFSGQVRTYIFTGSMYDTKSIKCTLRGKKRIGNSQGIPVTEFSVSNCNSFSFQGNRRINIVRIYIMGVGIDHRFSGSKIGGHIIFPRVGYFPNRSSDGFLY